MRPSADGLGLAIAAIALLLAGAARGDEAASVIHGEWLTEGARAIVRIGPCTGEAAADRLCGTIAWLWQPRDEAGQALTDRENPDAARRGRPLVGLDLLSGFRMSSPRQWSDGTVYNPEDGRTYKASLRLESAEEMTVEGCFLFVCRKQLWRRATSACARP